MKSACGHGWIGLAVIVVVALPDGAWSAPVPLLGVREKAAIKAKLHQAKLAPRLEAISELGKFPEAESVKILYNLGLHDRTNEVRLATYATLLKLRNERPVCDALIELLNHQARVGKPDAAAALLMGVLLSSALPDVEHSSQRYLDEQLIEARDGAGFVLSMCDLLAARGDVADLVPLVRLQNTKLFEQFGVRRGVVRATTAIEDKAAVEVLIGLLPKLDGEVKADVIEYLCQVAKMKLAETADWTAWWAENKAKFVFPNPFVRPPHRSLDQVAWASGSLYYGLPLYGQRLAFILDASHSMSGERMDAAKRELIKSLESLGDHVKFGVVVYNSGVVYWQRALVEATSANKAEATRFVNEIVPASNTATYDALEMGFEYDAEALYLLTDGAPTTGRFVAPADICKAIQQRNHSRRMSIYTIGIGPGPVGSPMEVFLTALAQQNYGIYRRVDE